MGVEEIRSLAKGLSKADQLPDIVRNLVRQLSLKKAGTFTGVAGGGKQQIDRVGIILSHILGGQANRNAIKQAWSLLPPDKKAEIVKEIGAKYSLRKAPGSYPEGMAVPDSDPSLGNATRQSPEGELIINYLTGRTDLSAEQLRSIAAAEEAADTGAKINPARGRSATFDSSTGTMTDGTETYDLDGGLGGANTIGIDPDLAVPPTPTSTTAQNPYSALRKSLAERGIIRNKFDTKTPLRSETQTEVVPLEVDGAQRRVPVTTIKGGQADRTLTGQISRAEKGKPVNEATEIQAIAGNSNPQAMYDDRLVRLADGGGGTAEDLWSTLAGPNASSTLRFNFESPREAAEAMVSMMTADIGAARTGGGISAGQIQELKNGRYYEGFTEADARTIAQDMGLETSGMGQSRKGLESIIEDLERVITREVGGSGWGAEARAAAESAGAGAFAPVPKDTPSITPEPGLEGQFPSGESLGDPVPVYENGVKKSTGSKSSPADPLPEVPKNTQSLEAAMETVSLERARSKAWKSQSKGAAMKAGVPLEYADLSPRMIEAQIGVLRFSDTPESAAEIARLEEMLPYAKRIASFVEGPYGTKSKALRYSPKQGKIYKNPAKALRSAKTPEELTEWGKHMRDNKDVYVDQLGEQGYQQVLAAGAKKRMQLGGGSPPGDKVKAKRKPQPQPPEESQPSDLDNAMPEGDPITPEPEVVTPADNTPPKVDPEFVEETIDPYTKGSPARQKPMEGETVGNDYKDGTKKGRTRKGRVVDEKPAAGDGGSKKPPEDPPKNNGDEDWERDYTPPKTETDPPPDKEGKGFWKRINNRWVWIGGIGAGLTAAYLNSPGDPNAPTDDAAALPPGGGGSEEISPEVMALAKEALGEGDEESPESSLIRELRQRKEEQHRRAQALEVNPNVQTNANWRR